MSAPSYFLETYHLQPVKSETILVTANTVARIKDPALCNLLLNLKSQNARWIRKNDLHERCAQNNLNPAEVENYLLNSLKLIREVSQRRSYARTLVVSDINLAPSLYTNIFASRGIDNINFIGLEFASDSQDYGIQDGDFISIVLKDYSDKLIDSLYAQARRKSGVSIIVSHFHGRKFRVGNLYSIDYGTPCHFCERGWEAKLSKKTSGTSSISSLLKVFEKDGVDALPSGDIYLSDVPLALAFLSSKMSVYTGLPRKPIHLENLVDRFTIDLDTLYIESAPSAHWPACDCQYKERAK